MGTSVRVGPFVSVGERSRLGDNVVLHPGVFVGDDVEIGDDCELFPQVVVRERISIGKRVIIHAGSVLGSDGFGYRWDGKQHTKIPQIGRVIVEDDVEIGSCVCIDRAKFSTTRIGKGTKIDNLVQIGHNVQTGPHCIIVGQVGLAGSVKLGAGVVLGGQSAVRDHITLGDGADGSRLRRSRRGRSRENSGQRIARPSAPPEPTRAGGPPPLTRPRRPGPETARNHRRSRKVTIRRLSPVPS